MQKTDIYQSILLITKKNVLSDLEIKPLLQEKYIRDIKKSILVVRKRLTSIKDVPNLINSISLKSDEDTIEIILLQDFDTYSSIIQNSLLKSIEEPYPNKILVLKAKNEYKVLKTIRSRCEILTYEGEKEKRQNNLLEYKNQLLDNNYLANIKLAEELVKLDKVEQDIVIDLLFEHLIENKENIPVISNYSKYKQAMKSNVNTKLVWTNIILDIMR